MNSQNHFQKTGQRNFSQHRKVFQKDSHFGYQDRYENRFQQRPQKPLSPLSFLKMTNVSKKNVPFKPDGSKYPNPNFIERSNVSFFKGKNDTYNLNQWFVVKGRQF